MLHREVLLRKLWGAIQIECERSQPERSLFKAGFSQGYLLILQGIAPISSLILSSLLEPKWSQVVQI
jgi:hypothetical protein